MKKNFLIIAMFIMCIFSSVSFASCKTSVKSEIKPKTLTDAQKEIIDLISNDKQMISFFTYDLKEDYKSFDVWLDSYNEGVLKNSLPMLSGMGDSETSIYGKCNLILTINKDTDIKWGLIQNIDGGKIISQSISTKNYNEVGYSFGAINEPVTIENNSEIILYAILFLKDGKIRSYSVDDLMTNPEYLKEYSYAYLVKCKFTK